MTVSPGEDSADLLYLAFMQRINKEVAIETNHPHPQHLLFFLKAFSFIEQF